VLLQEALDTIIHSGPREMKMQRQMAMKVSIQKIAIAQERCAIHDGNKLTIPQMLPARLY